MTFEGRREAVATELFAAEEEFHAAEKLMQAALYRIALTRAYFAVFHALGALLYSHDLAPRTHEGVQFLFNLHFVKAGVFEPAASRLVARLQKFREDADYAQAFVVDEAGVREEIEAASSFVSRVRAAISPS